MHCQGSFDCRGTRINFEALNPDLLKNVEEATSCLDSMASPTIRRREAVCCVTSTGMSMRGPSCFDLESLEQLSALLAARLRIVGAVRLFRFFSWLLAESALRPYELGRHQDWPPMAILDNQTTPFV